MITQLISKASDKKVLFVGERIKDVYHFGKSLGRPLKEPIICLDYQKTEEYEGGVLAAADHARSLVKSVDVMSTVSLRKERYLEAAKLRKLFEIYCGREEPACERSDFGSYDLVVVTDYGHGMMTPELIDEVCNKAKFLAVNVQTNAGNYGFNLATKYPSVDYLCMDETEARLATQNQYGQIEKSLNELYGRASRVVVTLGRNGAIGRDHTGSFWSCAVSDRVVDTMGAGDAFFAVSACIAEEASLQELLDIGNAAGALKVKSLGQKAVTKDELQRFFCR